MSLDDNEKALLEAVQSLFQQDSELGLNHLDSIDEPYAESSYNYLHGQINQMFAMKTIDSKFSDSLNQAFTKVHSYKYIDDPTFNVAFEKELTAQGIPKPDRVEALKFIEDIIKELKSESKEWEESNFGFNTDGMETMPEANLEFNIEEVEDWPMEKNVESEIGDASPGRTP